jgi:ATP-dependent helicase/nuclease subunit A
MPQLTIYKASAGSGKTWRLTVEYLKLLVANPESYRSILAVTFTNKATGEMKERVLNALYELMHIDPSAKPEGMLEAVCEELHMTPQQVKPQAIRAMSNLLHDYGRFRIETIDSFFQSVLRNLARELGLGTWLNLELNNNAVLSDAVDTLIDRASTDRELLRWITDYMEEMVQEGKSWKVEQSIKEFGKTIFKEYFQEKERELEHLLSDKHFLRGYRQKLKVIEREGTEAIQAYADRYFNLLNQNGLIIADISNGEKGVSSYFNKLKKGEFNPKNLLTIRVQEASENPEKWVTAKHPRRNEILSLAGEKLLPLLNETEAFRKEKYTRIITAKLTAKHLNQVGLLTDIAAEVRELNRENNRFLLSDTNILLKSLLDGADASFVYEKTGTELNHILFDEFQDTSRMQWDTFKPLLNEGLSNGFDSLIVGDEKQSIYRWRNGDWRILGNLSTEMRPAETTLKVLENNWRSERNIIDFNNALFTELERNLNEMHEDKFEQKSLELTQAYSDVAQKTNKQKATGLVDITFISTKEDSTVYQQLVMGQLLEKVEELQRAGIRPSDITILVRVNKNIPAIGEYFAQHKSSDKHDPNLCYDIVSDDAFLLASSKAIQILINALRLLNDPENPILEAQLKLDYQTDVAGFTGDLASIFLQAKKQNANRLAQKTGYKRTFIDSQPEAKLLPSEFSECFTSLQRMPLYELAEELYRMFGLERIPSQDSYLYCFMDKLSEYLLRGASDIAAFLTYWDEQLSTTSIPAGSSVNGIRILTIHKSKGLEFHTVLLPFCDWKLEDSKNSQIWCEPKTAPFNELSLAPIDFGESMSQSEFSEEYAEETLQLWVDSLNLLYVAFTRARHNLFVYGQGNDLMKKYKGPSTVAHLMEDLFKAPPGRLPEAWQNKFTPAGSNEVTETAHFRYGALSIGEAKEEKKHGSSLRQPASDISLPFRSFAHKTRFKQSNKSVEFSHGRDPEGYSNAYIDRGKLLHQLFSDIRNREDLSPALQHLQNEGLINSQEAEEHRLFAEKALSNPAVTDWYSGKYRLYNECSILCPGNDGLLQLKRPDRVMLYENDVQVVDFKFGKPSPKYRRQVLEYMSLLRSMGYATVQGFLWYVDENRIETVS